MMPTSHAVKFCDDDGQLLDVARDYIAGGARAQGTLILLATEAHLQALRHVAASEGCRGAKLVFLDAREMLADIMVGGLPEERRFLERVGGMIDGASRQGPVRVFGEMVAVLWTTGQPRAALCLEAFWNRLVERQACSLLCVYPIKPFVHGNHTEPFLEVCRVHTHVVTGASAARHL